MNILIICILFATLMVVSEFFRRKPKQSILWIGLILLISFPFWLKNPLMNDWFRWVKVYSVFVAIVLFELIRHTKLRENRKAYLFVYAILGINIIEAIIKNFSVSGIGSYLNIVAGVGLVVSLFFDINTIHVSDNKYKDLSTPRLTNIWIGWYSLWNIFYVYIIYTGLTWRHIAVLGSAWALSILHKQHSWLQERAYTLIIYILISFSFHDVLARYDMDLVYNDTVGLVIGIICNVLMVAYFVQLFYMKRNKKVEDRTLRQNLIIN